jgi:hypothetical protein
MDMVQVKDLGSQPYENSAVFKEKRIILVERENAEPIEIVIIETFDKNVFVDVKLRGQEFTTSAYITREDKYLSGKVNFAYEVIVDTSRYHDGSIVCEYVKQGTNKARKLVLAESKKEVEE